MADKTPEEIAAEKAAADKAAADKAAKASPRARVLIDHGEHKVDDIISGAAAEHAVKHGLADAHPSAVKHAEKLARQKARAAGTIDD